MKQNYNENQNAPDDKGFWIFVLSTNQQSGVNRKTEIYFRLMACLADSDNPLTVQSPGNGQQQTLNNNVYWRQ